MNISARPTALLPALLTALLPALLTAACTAEDAETAPDASVETGDAGAEADAEVPPCTEVPCASDEVCDSFTFRCHPTRGEGEACTPGPVEEYCRAGLVCNSLSKTCLPTVAEGEPCGSAIDCAGFGPGGLACDRTAQRCVPFGTLAAGTACSFDEECAPDLLCGPAPIEGGAPAPGDDWLTQGYRCRPLGAQGETCLFDQPDAPPSCQPDLVCTSRDGGVHATCEVRDH